MLGAEIIGAGGQCVTPGAFSARCAELLSTAERGDAQATGAVVAFAAGGALAVGAAVYLLWPEGGAREQRGLRWLPAVGPGRAGLGVRGAW